MFKKIKKTLTRETLALTDNQLSAISLITGADIAVGTAPLIGRYIVINGRRISENEPSHKDLEFAYEWGPDGELCRLYVGSQVHGPLLQWSGDGWRNLYGRGNHGKNGACGGNWSSASGKVYSTLEECLEARDYVVGDVLMHRSRMVEGPALIDALNSLTA